MPKNIAATVNKDGTIQMTYSGFSGKTCLAEAEKLAKQLAKLGVDLDVQKVVPTTEMNATSTLTKATVHA
ncbi:MAG: hypothetical protein ABSB40_00835 [Nitrososphaeria archaeon]|jgi:hypothetical protein